jgi:hypothetical protein
VPRQAASSSRQSVDTSDLANCCKLMDEDTQQLRALAFATACQEAQGDREVEVDDVLNDATPVQRYPDRAHAILV